MQPRISATCNEIFAFSRSLETYKRTRDFDCLDVGMPPVIDRSPPPTRTPLSSRNARQALKSNGRPKRFSRAERATQSINVAKLLAKLHVR